MKVIFIGDVPKVARVGQVKEVADGYARNFLFPRKLAVLADSRAAAAIDAHLKKLVRQRDLEEAEMAELAGKIVGTEIIITAKVGENEKLYGSVTGADIAEALSKSAGREIDKKKIELAEPIKQAGVFDVTVRLGHEITAVIKVNVIPEEGAGEGPAKAEKAEAAPKKEKKEKKAKAEKPPEEEKEDKVKAEKEEKPAKEKKTKADTAAQKSAEEEKPAPASIEAKAEDKKEKKSKAKAKKEE